MERQKTLVRNLLRHIPKSGHIFYFDGGGAEAVVVGEQIGNRFVEIKGKLGAEFCHKLISWSGAVDQAEVLAMFDFISQNSVEKWNAGKDFKVRFPLEESRWPKKPESN